MGLSTKKQSTKPVYAPQVEGAAASQTGTFNAQLPKITAASDLLGGQIPGLVDRFNQGDPNVNAARGYNADVLSGKYLNGNPFLQQMIDDTGHDTRNGIAASLGTRGLSGGSALMDITTRNLAREGNNMRYNDFNNQQSRMDQAAGMAPMLASAQYQPLNQAQDLLGAYSAPLDASQGNAGAIGGLLGNYTKTKSKGSIMDAIGMAIQAASVAASDRRLKENIERIGQTDGGLAIYRYNYVDNPKMHVGVMADEVEAAQPDALGPVVLGYATVNYGEIR